VELSTLKEMVDGDKWKWTVDMMEDHLSRFTQVFEVYTEPDGKGPMVKWFLPAKNQDQKPAEPQETLEITDTTLEDVDM
jgi:hypothetical protein